MEREYARQTSVRKTKDAGAQRASEEFVNGLQIMSANLEPLLYNFAWAAGQIAGEPDAPAVIRWMMEFAIEYHRYGLEKAMSAIEENSGIPVDITLGQDGKGLSYRRPGILVGLVGVEYSPSSTLFEGVAMIEDKRGRERFIAVSVKPDGSTQLHRDQYDYRSPDLISDKPIDKIFPRVGTKQ